MIKLDPEINHTAIRAIKTMSRIPESTSIVRIPLYTRAAFVTDGSRVQEGWINEIRDDSLTMERLDNTEITMLYISIDAIYLGDVDSSISRFDEDVFSCSLRNESGVAVNIGKIVPKNLPEVRGDNCIAVDPYDGAFLVSSHPRLARALSGHYNAIELHTASIFYSCEEKPVDISFIRVSLTS